MKLCTPGPQTKERTGSKWPRMATQTLDSGVGGIITNPRIQSGLKLAQGIAVSAFLRLCPRCAQFHSNPVHARLTETAPLANIDLFASHNHLVRCQVRSHPPSASLST